jgi:hypothetical protein
MDEEMKQAETFVREASKLAELVNKKTLVEVGLVKSTLSTADISERVVAQQKETARQLHELFRMWLG